MNSLDDITQFRGYSGEIIRRFVSPGIFLTAFGIIIYWIVIGVILFFVGHFLPALLQVLIILFASAIILGRIAMPASRGDLNAGLFSQYLEAGEGRDFAIRYCLFTLVWFIPVALLTWVLQSNLEGMIMSGAMGGGYSFASMGFHGFLFALLFVVCIAAPIFTAILSTYTQSIAEVFSAEPWAWLFQERRADLLPFIASILGGIFCFWLFYLIPLVLIAVLAFKASQGFGFFIASLIYLLPLALSPVLIARLSGAFVFGESCFEVALEDEILMASGSAGHSEKQTELVKATFAHRAEQATHGKENPFAHMTPDHDNSDEADDKAPDSEEMAFDTTDGIIQWVKLASTQEVQATLDTLSKNKPQSALEWVKLTYVQRKLKHEHEAILAAKQAIESLLDHTQYAQDALIVYQDFVVAKTQLQLSPVHLQKLGELLGTNLRYSDASWCLYFAAMLATPDEQDSAIEKLIALAKQAESQHLSAEALAIYKIITQKFSSSDLAVLAQDAINRLS